MLNYNSERKSISIDTTHEDNKYIDELKIIFNIIETSAKPKIMVEKIEGMSTSAA